MCIRDRSDSTIYIDGFKRFKRFTFDGKGRIISEELLEMKSIAKSNEKKVVKMAGKKKHAHSTVYEDCLTFKSICYLKNNTPKLVCQTMYDQSKTLLVHYHKNGNVSDSIFYMNKLVGESEYTLVKHGACIQYDRAGNKSSIKRFTNGKLVNETLFEPMNKILELNYENGRLARDAKLISENGENTDVCVKLDWQGNPKIYRNASFE
jgi:antitoxin component YwqK of YwqJK toxin-antitoxin module